MEHATSELREFISDLVIPHQRCNVNINPDHITMLEGTKIKKQHSRKRRAHKSSTLSRREYAALGLNTLPTKQMKYEEALPLHHVQLSRRPMVRRLPAHLPKPVAGSLK